MRTFCFDLRQPLEFTGCGNLTSHDGFLHMRRTFDHHLLILVLEGTLHITRQSSLSTSLAAEIESEPSSEASNITNSAADFDIGPGQYILLRAGETHYGSHPSMGKLSYYWAHFHTNSKEIIDITPTDIGAVIKEATYTDGSKNNLIINEKGDTSRSPRASLLFNQLLDLSRQSLQFPQQTDYAVTLLLMEISRAIIETYTDQYNNIPMSISRIIEWLRANCHEPITTQDVATEFSYNSDYLSALFHKSTGSTLTSYINKLRIEVAKSLLINYSITVKEAAHSCGIFDEKYFMRLFKKYEGMTPSQYREAFTKKSFNVR